MTESLLSVGIDLGTSTTQLVISRLTLENRANAFSVPRITISEKEILYRSAIYFTPLRSETVIDAAGVRAIVDEEYRNSGFHKEEISTGAVIITGETARKENAREVLAVLSEFAGDFVVATAGPDLESILAARGAGADVYAREHHVELLHFDIGGGTSNLARYDGGELRQTDCLNIGGRLIKLRPDGTVHYVSQTLGGPPGAAAPTGKAGCAPVGAAHPGGPRVGDVATPQSLAPLMEALVDELEGAIPPGVKNLSFSGGVADCMWTPPEDWLTYGDIGVLLGQAIRRRFEGQGYHLIRGAETIRATVVGAGTHATDISGSTIFYRDMVFPLKNLPILKLSQTEERGDEDAIAAAIAEKLPWFRDEEGMSQIALGLRGEKNPSYRRVEALANGISKGLEPLRQAGFIPIVVVESDMGKTLGQALYMRLREQVSQRSAPCGEAGPLLCLDGIGVENGDYIDIGSPVAQGAVLPVVIKTLAFGQSAAAAGRPQN